MLRNSGQLLIQEELQAIVVGADKEVVAPKVRSPVPYSLHQTDELPLIHRQLVMASGEGSAEEG